MNYLAENIHKIDWDNLPGQEQCDPYGEILLYSRKVGWVIAHYTDIEETVKDCKCSYWTYLPEAPFVS
jgi:hypothetical protein